MKKRSSDYSPKIERKSVYVYVEDLQIDFSSFFSSFFERLLERINERGGSHYLVHNDNIYNC